MNPRNLTRSLVCALTTASLLVAAPAASAVGVSILGIDVAADVDATVGNVAPAAAPIVDANVNIAATVDVAPVVAATPAPATSAPAPAPAPTPAPAGLLGVNADIGVDAKVTAPAVAPVTTTAPKPIIDTKVDAKVAANVGSGLTNGSLLGGTGGGQGGSVPIVGNLLGGGLLGGTSPLVGSGGSLLDLNADIAAQLGVSGGGLLGIGDLINLDAKACVSIVLLGPAGTTCRALVPPTTPEPPITTPDPIPTPTDPTSGSSGTPTHAAGAGAGGAVTAPPITLATEEATAINSSAAAGGAGSDGSGDTLSALAQLGSNATLPFTGAQLLELVLLGLVLLLLGGMLRVRGALGGGGATA